MPMIRKIDCSPKAIIGPSERFTVTRHHNGRTADIIDTILYADERSASYVLPGVQCLVGTTDRDTLRNVWAFIRNNLTYRADRPGHERVKSPGALFAEGVGDCKSYSISTGAILRSLGIPYRYRFTAYEPGDVTHVYVVADTASGPVILDSVHTRFDSEVPYYRKKDIRPTRQRQAVAGLPTDAAGDTSYTFSPWLAALLAFIIGKFLLRA
jgi:hypothetical protein